MLIVKIHQLEKLMRLARGEILNRAKLEEGAPPKRAVPALGAILLCSGIFKNRTIRLGESWICIALASDGNSDGTSCVTTCDVRCPFLHLRSGGIGTKTLVNKGAVP